MLIVRRQRAREGHGDLVSTANRSTPSRARIAGTGRVETQWVHTLDDHDIGSVIGWPGADSPTGWWSGIVRERAACSVRVDDIRPGVMT